MAQPTGNSGRWMYTFGAGAVVVIAVAAGAMLAFGGARLEGQTPRERIACIRRLSHDRPMGAGRAIAGAADDADESVRRAVMTALAKFTAPKFREVVTAGTRDASAAVRSAAAGTLALYADNAAADRLGELAAGDPEARVRMEAIGALGDCDARMALVLLVENMENSRERDVRIRAAEVLARKYNLDHRHLDPKDLVRWRHFVETIKGAPGVEEAFGSVSRPLERHPEHLIPPPPEH